jgi:uncharacterized membrane protein
MRRGRLDYVIGALTLFGVGVATYLVYVHYAGIKPFCVSSGGCEVVQSSAYADFVGVPVALLGLIGYILIFISLFVPGDLGRGVTAALTLSGFGFSAYLTYLELFEIKAICQWCVASAVIMTVLMVLSMIRFLSAPPEVAAGDGEPDTPDSSAADTGDAPDAEPAGATDS